MTNIKTKVLVTGVNGYIGSFLARELKKQGFYVIGCDLKENINNSCAEFFCKSYDFINIQNTGIEYVFHLAAESLVGPSIKNPLKYYNTNVKKQYDFILKWCMSKSLKKVIFSSSAAVYSNSERPLNPYGSTKLISEMMLHDLFQNNNIDVVSLRYFNVCGASKDGKFGQDFENPTHLITTVLKNAINKKDIYIFGNDYDTYDGTCIRDYIHVDDVVSANIKAMNYKTSGTFDVGTGKGISNLEIVKNIKKFTNLTFEYKFKNRRLGDPPKLISNTKKTISELNWLPSNSSIDNIIKSAYKWQLSNKENK